MSHFETFFRLHHQPEPLLLANVWDAHSAQLFEASGYKAAGTSSHALATAMGYTDGEQLPFSSLLQAAKQITAAVKIPFTADIEGGYSRNTNEIISHISSLYDAGVAGINLEDTIAGKERVLQPVAAFQKTIAAIMDYNSRNNINIFVNIRTDAFLLGMPNALAETLSRINLYEKAGVHGIFVPCITAATDISSVVRETRLPINVMCMPSLPGFGELQQLGVKRISMGPFFFNKVYAQIKTLSAALTESKNFSTIL